MMPKNADFKVTFEAAKMVNDRKFGVMGMRYQEFYNIFTSDVLSYFPLLLCTFIASYSPRAN